MRYPSDAFGDTEVSLDLDDDLRDHQGEGNPVGAVLGGVVFIIMAFVFLSLGAPGAFAAFMIVIGIIMIIGYKFEKDWQEDRWARRVVAYEEAQERIRRETVQTVKESLKGTVKVRCKYCAGLNDENDEKCESCGAPL